MQAFVHGSKSGAVMDDGVRRVVSGKHADVAVAEPVVG
jgi:hypothetical protein